MKFNLESLNRVKYDAMRQDATAAASVSCFI